MENSIAVTSVTQPGIVFGVNDSGHEPLVFAFDSTGVERGVWAIPGARNLDWEAAALGPCAAGSTTPSCLYIGDVGDNAARKPQVTIYRVPEPTALPWGRAVQSSPAALSRASRLDVRYPDHPHDVEAMYVLRDGAVFLITKRRLLDPQQRPRPALVFRISPSAWDSSGVVTAVLVDSLPVVPGESPGRQVTDAALSPDGRLLAVRTYAEVFIFGVDSVTGRPVAGGTPTSCVVVGLDEKQGEGVGWWWDGQRLLLTSEGRNEPLRVVRCPLPKGQP